MVNSGRIVVIDDEESMRDSCRQALVRAGYSVETAPDGEAGLNIVKNTRPDLALVDLKMPGIGGIDLLKLIHEFDPTIITLVITGYASVESAVEAMKQDAYDFLPKPFTPDQLRLIVKRGIEHRKMSLTAAKLKQEKEMMKRNFITFVSHQLRSPLAAVSQITDVILGNFVGNVPEKQRDLLEDIHQRVSHLSGMINEWLDLARIESGTIASEFETMDLKSVILETVESLWPAARRNRVALEMKYRDDIPFITGNRQCLTQLFMNLVANGINYNRPDGTVTVAGRVDEESVIVEISDTGIGIPEDELPYIFDDFYRVKRDETRGISGTGLGLPIAKRIVELHHGTITIRSKPGEGTTFTVTLPLRIEDNHENH